MSVTVNRFCGIICMELFFHRIMFRQGDDFEHFCEELFCCEGRTGVFL